MKSLEIVNLRVKRLNNKPEMELVKNDEMVMISNNDMGYAGILTLTQLETIKQDLEVLEILRRNLYLWYTRYWNEEIEIHTKLTTYTNPKEFQKVKQWLEENENDR